MTMWGTQIAKLIFKKKNEIGGFTIPDVKTYIKLSIKQLCKV